MFHYFWLFVFIVYQCHIDVYYGFIVLSFSILSNLSLFSNRMTGPEGCETAPTGYAGTETRDW